MDGADDPGGTDRTGELPAAGSIEWDDVPDAFDVLADETRWAIVRELATYRRTNWQLGGLGFADLRRAVGVTDAGRFNYHLNQLRDRFVLKLDDSYVLSNEALELVGTVLAGAYETAPVTRRDRADRRCPRCDEPVELIYEHGYVRLECVTHGTIFGTVVPKRPAVDRSTEDLVRIAGRATRNDIAAAAAGSCPHCWGVAETSIAAEPPEYPETELDERAAALAFVTISCGDCGFRYELPATVFLVDQPAVVAFRHDHGDDQCGVPLLDTSLTYALSRSIDREDPSGPAPGTAADHAPPFSRLPASPADAAAVAEFAYDRERLAVWLDDHASVIGIERHDPREN